MNLLSFEDIKVLEKWSNSCSINDYCFNFADFLNIKILNANTINYLVSKNNKDELFPEFNNCSKYFNEANLEFIIGFFVNLNKINLSWFIDDFEYNKKDYTKEIINSCSKSYLFNNISFDFREAMNKPNGFNLYMFLFFMPLIKKEDVSFISNSNTSILAHFPLDFGIYKNILRLNVNFKVNKENLMESIIDNTNIDDIENRQSLFKQKVLLLIEYVNGNYNINYRDSDVFFNNKLDIVNKIKKEWMFNNLNKNLKLKKSKKDENLIKV